VWISDGWYDIKIVAYKNLSVIHEINVRKWLELIVATMELLIGKVL